MARHLCIVARDNSPLYGFLTIAFGERPAGADVLDVVLDRRRAEANHYSPSRHTDRRRHGTVAEALRARGYAIVAGPGGLPRVSDEAFIERAVGILADVERRGPLALQFHQRRRAVVRAIVGAAIGAVSVFAIAWVLLVTLPTIGGLARIADDLGRWTDAGVSRLNEAWTALRGMTSPIPTAREPGGERARPPEPATSVAESSALPSPAPPAPALPSPAPPAPALPSPTLTAPAETERAAPALPPRPRRAPVPESRAASKPTRTLEHPSGPVVSARSPAPRETPARGAQSRDGLPREASLRESAPLESSELVDTRSLTAFSGLPRVELSRQSSGSGRGIVYTVRLADPGGRPVPGAEVWMRGQSGDGQARETRLDAVDPPGTYRSGPLPPGTLPPPLSVRVYFSNMRVEVPVEP
jgi:hypothetical protein